MLDSIILHQTNSNWGFEDLKQGDLLIFGLFFNSGTVCIGYKSAFILSALLPYFLSAVSLEASLV